MTKLAVMFLADISDSISDDGLTETDGLYQRSYEIARRESASRSQSHSRTRQKSSKGLSEGEDEPDAELKLAEIKKTWLDTDEDAGDTTDIAQALEKAWGFFPANANKRIVLITDGVETQGDALHTALRGKDFGIQIDTGAGISE